MYTQFSKSRSATECVLGPGQRLAAKHLEFLEEYARRVFGWIDLAR